MTPIIGLEAIRDVPRQEERCYLARGRGMNHSSLSQSMLLMLIRMPEKMASTTRGGFLSPARGFTFQCVRVPFFTAVLMHLSALRPRASRIGGVPFYVCNMVQSSSTAHSTHISFHFSIPIGAETALMAKQASRGERKREEKQKKQQQQSHLSVIAAASRVQWNVDRTVNTVPWEIEDTLKSRTLLSKPAI